MSHRDFPPTSHTNLSSVGENAEENGSLLVVWGEVVSAGAGVACGLFFPGPCVGDVCVGPGDDEGQDEDGHDEGADACGSACACRCGAHGCTSVVVAVIKELVMGSHGT